VVERVVDADAALAGEVLGLVLVRAALRVALEAPCADERPVVRVPAVRPDEQAVGVRRDQHRVVEPGEVEDRPRREDEDEGGQRGAPERRARAPPRPRRDRHGDGEQHDQRERLAARERGQGDERPERGGAAPGRRLAHPQRAQQRRDEEEAVQRLAHERAVGEPEHRVDRGKRGGGQADAVARHPPPHQADEHDGDRPDRAEDQPVREEAVGAELVPERQEDLQPRRVLGGRSAGREGLDEALAVGQPLRDEVERHGVAQHLEVAVLDGVDRPHGQRQQGDEAEALRERAESRETGHADREGKCSAPEAP